MSTSPDEPQSAPAKPAQRPTRTTQERRAPSPLRGLVWLSVWIGLIVIIAMFPELVTEYFLHGVELGLEVAEQSLDVGYEMIGLSHAVAPIATAYTGLVIALALLYFLVRKSMIWYRKTQETVSDYKALYASLCKKWWASLRQRVLDWWETLDWMHRIAVIVFLVLIGIPLALLLSFVLGSAVTVLLF